MANCMRENCRSTARWQLAADIWALAMKPSQRTSKNCARMLTGLVVCDAHRADAEQADLFGSAESRARIYAGFQRAGGALPDLASAKLVCVGIVDRPIDIDQQLRDARRRGAQIHEA